MSADYEGGLLQLTITGGTSPVGAARSTDGDDDDNGDDDGDNDDDDTGDDDGDDDADLL